MTILTRLEQWKEQGKISPEQHAHLAGLSRGEPFSLFFELNVLLYAGVLAFVAGLGWTVSMWSQQLGDVLVLTILSAILAACFWYCFSRADPQSGKKVCVFHDPARAADVRRARRSGGTTRSRTATVLPQETPDNPLRNTHEIVTLLSESINHVRRGQLDPRVANAVGYLSGILLKALEQGRTEERLSHLEAVLGCNKGAEAEVFHFVPAKGAQT